VIQEDTRDELGLLLITHAGMREKIDHDIAFLTRDGDNVGVTTLHVFRYRVNLHGLIGHMF
jgi:hypothetical protein